MSSLYNLIPLGDAPEAGFDLVAIIAAVTEPDVFTFEQPAAVDLAAEAAAAATSTGAEYREEPDPSVGWHDALLFA